MLFTNAHDSWLMIFYLLHVLACVYTACFHPSSISVLIVQRSTQSVDPGGDLERVVHGADGGAQIDCGVTI